MVELTLFSSTYGDEQWSVSPFNPVNNVNGTNCTEWRKLNTPANGNVLDRQRALVRYLAWELNGFDNLIYEIQNEPWSDNHDLGEWINPYVRQKNGYPNRVVVTRPISIAWQTEIARAFHEAEKGLPLQHVLVQDVAKYRLSIRPAGPRRRRVGGELSLRLSRSGHPKRADRHARLLRRDGVSRAGRCLLPARGVGIPLVGGAHSTTWITPSPSGARTAPMRNPRAPAPTAGTCAGSSVSSPNS